MMQAGNFIRAGPEAAELIEQRVRRLQIRHVETFDETAVNRLEE